MKDETINQIVGEIDEMLAEARFSAAQVFAAMLDSPLPPRYRKPARIGLTAGLKPAFKSLPEPTKAELGKAIAFIRAFKNAPHKIRTLLKRRIKELPRARGGPSKKIKPEDERIVCAEIMALRAECETRAAIRRVAAKRNSSERTIYRVWGKYHPKKKKRTNATKF